MLCARMTQTIAIACVFLMHVENAAGQVTQTQTIGPTKITTDNATGKTTTDARDGATVTTANIKERLYGAHWGIGIATSSGFGGIGAATLEPGTNKVRVSRQNGAAARAAFEIHYFLPSPFGPYKIDDIAGKDKLRIAWGPYVSLNTSPIAEIGGSKHSAVFDSASLGWMLGMQTGAEHQSYNIAIGAIIDTKVLKLADGVAAGQPTSITDVTKLTKETTQVGWQIMFSYKLFTVNLE